VSIGLENRGRSDFATSRVFGKLAALAPVRRVFSPVSRAATHLEKVDNQVCSPRHLSNETASLSQQHFGNGNDNGLGLGKADAQRKTSSPFIACPLTEIVVEFTTLSARSRDG